MYLLAALAPNVNSTLLLPKDPKMITGVWVSSMPVLEPSFLKVTGCNGGRLHWKCWPQEARSFIDSCLSCLCEFCLLWNWLIALRVSCYQVKFGFLNSLLPPPWSWTPSNFCCEFQQHKGLIRYSLSQYRTSLAHMTGPNKHPPIIDYLDTLLQPQKTD